MARQHKQAIGAAITVFCILCAVLKLATRPPPLPRYAFATFLGGFTAENSPLRQSRIGGDPDGYFLGVRYLNYMLKHNPMTRSRQPIPLIVLATIEVQPHRIQQLRDEGAQVVVTEKVAVPPWMSIGDSRYEDVLTKLKLWQLTEFDKIAYFDADILVSAPLDDIFEDPATIPRLVINHEKETENLPRSYVFAAQAENYHYDHPIPPTPIDRPRPLDQDIAQAPRIRIRALEPDYMNAGFLVISPDRQLYDLYMSILEQSFEGGMMPEQDLFNLVHNQTGPMPWQPLHWQWNAHYPTIKDFRAGVKSMHDKYWEDDATDPDFRNDKVLRALWREQVREMEDHYRKT